MLIRYAHMVLGLFGWASIGATIFTTKVKQGESGSARPVIKAKLTTKKQYRR